MLEALGVETLRVKTEKELLSVDGLILPGGESTTMTRLLEDMELYGALQTLKQRQVPIFGTCAGLILMSKEVEDGADLVKPLGFLDITVRRNAYGRQRESFESDLEIQFNGESETFRGIFIRAPRIVKVGTDVQILATHQGEPVMVRQGHALGSTFHPELSGSTKVHEYFLEIVKEAKG